MEDLDLLRVTQGEVAMHLCPVEVEGEPPKGWDAAEGDEEPAKVVPGDVGKGEM